ncbi:heat shock 70 kDa protein 12A-like isoform X2 [Mytilus californianus]|nr:heat shock 70 kDa protein 12A-like isoform X2 [Mytilus californianus]
MALDVFSLSIKALKDHFLNKIREQIAEIDIDDIRWVLTVPAIWSDGAKQFMRSSAEKAGIPSNRLRIALEPEAASIYCQYLPTEKLEGAEKGFTVADIGTKYMVVDLGGGTVDITVHEKKNDGSLKEICHASGADYGGTSVDRTFFKLIESIIGTAAMKEFKSKYLELYLDLSRDFEIKKRNFGTSEEIRMFIPFMIFEELCEKHLNKNFKSAIESSKFSTDIATRYGNIRIKEDTFISVFQQTIVGITKLIGEILNKKGVDGLSQIILVGGFSECTLVKKEIKSTFPDKKVIVPIDSGMAVLKGAVIFGNKPGAISERIAKCTYGFSKRKKFDPQKHDRSHLEIVDGKDKCSHVFDPIVKRNEILPLGKEVISTAKLKPENNGLFTLLIYQTEKDNPVYTDEDDCSVLGTITEQISDTGTSDKIKVKLIFGETEIRIKIKERATHKEWNGKIEMI